MTLGELNSHIVVSLLPSLGEGEARATARLLLEDDLGVTPTTLVLRPDRELEPETVARFERYINSIASGMPPQYAVGKARFMGMELKVTPATLIPRPETAELVDIIVETFRGQPDLHACDLGTGSGCIAIALARALPFLNITAVDLSADALAVARENASSLRAKVDFLQADILAGLPAPALPYDFIVSNPPYIADFEEKDMELRVTRHEPRQALFVPDSDPLLFYRSILNFATESLAAKGRVFFEINPLFADDLKQMCSRFGFNCQIELDSFGHKRFAILHR